MRDSVVQAAAGGVREDDFQPGYARFEKEGHARDGAARAGAGDERRDGLRGLRVPRLVGAVVLLVLVEDLRAGGAVVRVPVRGVFELVGEEASSWAGGVGGVGGGEGARAVDVVGRVDDGGGGDEVDGCAEGEEEGGFLGGLVGRHAAAGDGQERV